MKKTKILVAIFFVITVSLFSVSQVFGQIFDLTSRPVTPDEADRLGINRNDNPAYNLKANAVGDKYLSKEQVISKAFIAKDAKVLRTEMASWGEFMKNSKSKNAQIDPARKTWIVETYYANGIEHPKVGLMKNAIVISAYDAVSGEPLATIYKALPEGVTPNN